MKYAVQASGMTPVIHVGRVGKSGDAFLDKEDATDMILAAVGQYVRQNFGGGMRVTFPGLGFEVEVRVSPLPQINGTEQG